MSYYGICTCFGVHCRPREGSEATQYNDNSHFLKLRVNGIKLRGTLPSELSALERLQILDVGSNLLEGSIPPQLGDMEELGT